MITFFYIREVLVYEVDRRNYGEFFLNTEDYPDANDKINNDVLEFNKKMPLFKQIAKVRVRDTEFPKTTTLKIVRKY